MAGRADSVHVDGPHHKLVLCVGHKTLQHHGSGLDGLPDVRPLSVHLWSDGETENNTKGVMGVYRWYRCYGNICSIHWIFFSEDSGLRERRRHIANDHSKTSVRAVYAGMGDRLTGLAIKPSCLLNKLDLSCLHSYEKSHLDTDTVTRRTQPAQIMTGTTYTSQNRIDLKSSCFWRGG